MLGGIAQRPKAEMQVECPGGLINRIDLHSPSADMLRNSQRSPQGVHNKQRSQPLPLSGSVDCKLTE
jgi:hypothetical protein